MKKENQKDAICPTSIEVYNIGTMVFVGNKAQRNINAEITAICIRSNYITYEVAWWNGMTRTTAWIEQKELMFKKAPEKIAVGFANE